LSISILFLPVFEAVGAKNVIPLKHYEVIECFDFETRSRFSFFINWNSLPKYLEKNVSKLLLFEV
jgi:hypothetical protein